MHHQRNACVVWRPYQGASLGCFAGQKKAGTLPGCQITRKLTLLYFQQLHLEYQGCIWGNGPTGAAFPVC